VGAVGDETVVVEDLADLARGDLPAEDRRVLVVAGELDLLVADLGEAGEDPLEAVGDAGGVRRRGDPVADAVEDDAAVAGGDQGFHPEPPAVTVAVVVGHGWGAGGDHGEPGGAEYRCRARRGAEDVAAGELVVDHVRSSPF
jgi:hypothetical protein